MAPPDSSVAIIVPWTPDSMHAAAWGWLRSRWQARCPAWQIVEVQVPPVRFNAAQAVNRGAREADADVLVIAYADTLVDEEWLLAAVAQVGRYTPVVAPEVVGHLGRFETADVLAYAPDADVSIDVHGPLVEYRSHGWPGVAVTTRRHLLRIPFDESFVGAAYEGDAWLVASRVLGARVARTGAALHLWHPTPPEATWGAWEAAANRSRYERYVRADEESMRILVESLK